MVALRSPAEQVYKLQTLIAGSQVITADSQPTFGGGVIVFVCGNLKVDGSDNAMKFSQVYPPPVTPSHVLLTLCKTIYANLSNPMSSCATR